MSPTAESQTLRSVGDASRPRFPRLRRHQASATCRGSVHRASALKEKRLPRGEIPQHCAHRWQLPVELLGRRAPGEGGGGQQCTAKRRAPKNNNLSRSDLRGGERCPIGEKSSISLYDKSFCDDNNGLFSIKKFTKVSFFVATQSHGFEGEKKKDVRPP